MKNIDLSAITLDYLKLPLLKEKRVNVAVLRLDKIHPVISGNKWFKLQFYLEDALRSGKKTIMTRGGSWSNHLLATAAACQLHNLRSVGIVRGEEPRNLSTTLIQAKEYGMELVFVNREAFRNGYIPGDIDEENAYVIDAGGYGRPGMFGASTILSLVNPQHFHYIACAMGTGTMLAGLCYSANANTQLIGISVMKNNFQLGAAVNGLLENQNSNYTINHDYHFGGYAHMNSSLIAFMNIFFEQTGIPTDFVYTSKLFYGLLDLIGENYFPAGSQLLVIHSGGLQGNDSLSKGTLIF